MLQQEIEHILETHLHTDISEIFMTKPVNYPSECIVFKARLNNIQQRQALSEYVRISAVDYHSGISQCYITKEQLGQMVRLRNPTS